MAPKLLLRVVASAIILSLGFSTLPTQAKATSFSANETQEEIKQHTFKIYLDPLLMPDMDFAQAVLPEYVEDMNAILAKNTNRRLVFDPQTDIILTTVQPFSNWAASPLPVEGFEIWAHAIKGGYNYSYGGYGAVDSSGAGVLAGLRWAKLYDPNHLSITELKDYWTQVNNMLHELAHIFGAGLGEYYKLSQINDTTGVFPLLGINVHDPNDAFWLDKVDFKTDPLLWNPVLINRDSWTSRQALLDYVKFSELTATIISRDYRNSAPTVDLAHLTVRIVDESGEPIELTNVKIWSVVGATGNPSSLMVDALSDHNGEISFSWGGSNNPHNNYDFLRLIKVSKAGYNASAKYVSIFDTDKVRLIHGSDQFVAVITLQENVQPPVLAEGETTTVTMSEDASPTHFSLTLSIVDAAAGNLAWDISSHPAHGTAAVNANGSISAIDYVPNPQYSGFNSFIVKVEDDHGGVDSITVNVQITPLYPSSFTIFLPSIQR